MPPPISETAALPTGPAATQAPTDRLAPLRHFVQAVDALLDTPAPEPAPEPVVLAGVRALLTALVADDGWLPEALAQPDPVHYRQYRLHVDPAGRYSVVSFVWGPGQATPVHDHTVWGLIGMLRGAEIAEPYRLERDAGGLERAVPDGPPQRLSPGQVEAVSPTLGDVHRVRNALDDAVSISIHVYGADIGAVWRHVYPPEGGRKAFVSGYSNAHDPAVLEAHSVPTA